jgi:hypothetical protein
MNNEEPQILVKLQGGLGNIMFQLASMESFRQLTGLSIRYTNFNEQAREYFFSRAINFPGYQNNIFSKILGGLNFQSKINRHLIEENEFFDDLSFLFNIPNSFFVGYLQNHNFFLNKNFVANLFDFSDIFIPEYYLHIIEAHSVVSMHVRRGDYLNNQHILPCPTAEWYHNAIQSCKDYDKIFLFSDDIAWCKKNFKNPKIEFISQNELNELQSLKLMTLCHQHIICNSTFSWWGAYLSDSEKVIMPGKWFGPAIMNPRPITHYKLNYWEIL